MKVRKAIKKIVALGIGASMFGATILGAAAADLTSYPSPFVKNGVFDAVVVVGGAAATADVAGAIDVAASLQYEMKQETGVVVSGAEVTISDGVKIERPGVKFQYGDDIENIDEKLTDDDLPVILADETYSDYEGDTDNEEEYTQTLEFADGTGTVVYTPDTEADDEPIGDYVLFDSGETAYTYTLDFDDPIEFAGDSESEMEDDFQSTILKIQGNEYTITKVDFNGTDETDSVVNEITLQAGDTVIWLQQGKVLTREIGGESHEIEVIDVSDSEDKCGISVDGSTVWINVDSTQTVNGVKIGVTEAVAVHAQLQDTDICKVNLGAQEVKLKDGDEITVNGVEVDGSNVEIDDATVAQLDSIEITYDPDDDVFIGVDTCWADPVLGNFEVCFGGMSKVTEEITIKATGDSAELKFVNNNGDEIEIPTVYEDDAATVVFGEDYDLASNTSNGNAMLLANGDLCNVTGNSTECEGILLLTVTDGNEVHVLEVTNIDWDDLEVDLKDHTAGKTYDDRSTQDADDELDLGYMEINLDITFSGANSLLTATTIIETGADSVDSLPILATSKSGGIVLDGAANATIRFYEDYDSSDNSTTTNNAGINISLEPNSDADEIELDTPVSDDSLFDPEPIEDGSDIESTETEWGTIVTWDSDNQDDLTVLYPEEEADANVFISPVGAEIIGAAGGEITAMSINKIGTLGKLDSEVAGQETNQNMIVVGGPCINTAAAKLMGSDSPLCGEASGISAGSAVIQLFQNGDNVAMLVAGYEAAQTRLACNVVVNYDSADIAPSFTGTGIEVTGTSLTDLEIKALG